METYTIGVTVKESDFLTTSEEIQTTVASFKEELLKRKNDIDDFGWWDEEELRKNPEMLLDTIQQGAEVVMLTEYASKYEIPSSDRMFHVYAFDMNFPDDIGDSVMFLCKAVKVLPELGARLGVVGDGIIL